MTEKQKQAVKILNGLWNNNGGLMKLSEEEYFLLLECVLGGEENTKWISRTILPNVPTLQCYEKDGVCTNSFHDCINCPKTNFHSDGAGTFTTTNIKDNDTNRGQNI